VIYDETVMTGGAYLDALIGSRMCIKERYVQATGLLEGAEALKHPV